MRVSEKKVVRFNRKANKEASDECEGEFQFDPVLGGISVALMVGFYFSTKSQVWELNVLNVFLPYAGVVKPRLVVFSWFCFRT